MSPGREARTAILARVRAAQRTAVLPSPHTPRDAEPPGDSPAAITDSLARFEQELSALGVEVHHAGSAESARDAVRRAVNGKRVLSWDAAALPHDVFGVLTAPCVGSSTRDEQAAAEIGLTACDAAVAETGSLVLLSGPGRARTVSLLPRTHLAIVRRGDIVPTLGDAFDRLHDRLRVAASCTVITGPSRTADIELTLTLGIHGPGHLIVVIAP
jgi:L-lactate dehydrogenase complex protein LldG